VAAIPLTGLPRDSRLTELTDAQLGRLVDWSVCLFGNGYRHACCNSTMCPSTPPGYPAIGPFRDETAPLLADTVSTCYATPADEASAPSREEVMTLYRSTYGNCHVGLYEDCMRGNAVATFGAATANPACTEYNNLCGAL
jgi:hypothetical protein